MSSNRVTVVGSAPNQVSISTAITHVVVSAAGPQGPRGEVGPAGPSGPAGANQLANLTDVDLSQAVDGGFLYYDLSGQQFRLDNMSTGSALTDGGNF